MTSTFRHRLFASAFVMVAAAMGFSAGPALAQKQGGTLTVGLELDIAGFDPLKVGVYDTSANIAASLLLEQLTGLGDDGKAKPKLALSWSSSEDYKTWTFKLRPDVKFHEESGLLILRATSDESSISPTLNARSTPSGGPAGAHQLQR